MSEYRDDWFSFEIKSQRHVLDLIIEPSFAKAICFQVHEMKNNSYQLFWNYGMVGKEIGSSLIEYAKINNLNQKMSIGKIYDSKEFNEYMRANAPEVFIADLDEDDMNLVNAVVNANWSFEEYICGLDGHHYRIKIYGEQIREFECWCYIPESWSEELIPLVNRLIEIAKLEPDKIHYEVKGVRRNTTGEKKFYSI